MALPDSQTTRELARLGADFAMINISNSHITCSKLRNESQIHGKTERSLLLPVQNGNNSYDEGTIPGATILLNLHLLILDSSQYINLSNASKHSTRMRC